MTRPDPAPLWKHAPQRTRTTTTVSDYERIEWRLVRQAALDRNPDNPEPFINPADVVEYLIQQKGWLSKSTFRKRRAALLHQWGPLEADGNSYARALERLRAEPQTDAGERLRQELGRPSRASKVKRIPEDDLEALCDALDRMRGRWAPRLKWLLRAGLASGVRPEEWPGADLTDDVLSVRNAKATNGRAAGPMRSIPLSGSDLDDVTQHMRAVWRWRGETDLAHATATQFEAAFKASYLNHCRVLLNRVRQRLWGDDPRRAYTLTSVRHQFAANLKNVADESTTAGAMGHGSTHTARRHYGRRSAGHARFRNPALNAAAPAVEPVAPAAPPGTPGAAGGGKPE